jgi:microcystin degradation protein MlrC
MRIAIGEFAHETNTFLPGTTGLDAFRRSHWYAGEALLAAHRGVRDDLGGMIAAGERLGIEIVPTFATRTEPSAAIALAAYVAIRDELFGALAAAGEVDAICLALHGAGSAEGIDDSEGRWLEELRARFGREIPVVVTLDLHGHTTRAMVENATALLYCHEYPHTDMFERGEEAVELAAGVVRGEVRPVMHLEELPMILPPSTTMSGPAKAINVRCFAWEARRGMIDCAFTHGFPHTDVDCARATVLATSNGDAALAREAAEDVARAVWEMREAFRQDLPGPPEVVVEAVRLVEEGTRPVVIAEISDNPGGGAPGDGTHLLRAMLAADVAGSCFGFVFDPQTAAQAHQAGVGRTIRVRLGGKTDPLHGAPIETDAYVKCLTDGQFRYTTPMGAGRHVDLGPMARLTIDNVEVLVSSVRTQTLDDEVFRLHGIDVTRASLVGVKSQNHFRAGFAPLAGAILRTDPPGWTTNNLAQLPYARAPRPAWPLDPEATYPV